MDDPINQIRRDAVASCAWIDAVDPYQAASLRAMFGGGGAETFESVRRRLGDAATQAWQDAATARRRYFEAIK